MGLFYTPSREVIGTLNSCYYDGFRNTFFSIDIDKEGYEDFYVNGNMEKFIDDMGRDTKLRVTLSKRVMFRPKCLVEKYASHFPVSKIEVLEKIE